MMEDIGRKRVQEGERKTEGEEESELERRLFKREGRKGGRAREEISRECRWRDGSGRERVGGRREGGRVR